LDFRSIALAAAGIVCVTIAAPAATSGTVASINLTLPLRLFSYDKHAALELREDLLDTIEGVSVRAISYNSPKGGRVSGRLFVPTGAGRFAGVVLAHGAPGNAEAFTGRAVYIAKHGAVVIVIDAPFNRREGRAWNFTSRDRDEQIQLIDDLQRAVDILRSRPDTDPSRIAYVGRSYGGATGALFVGVERRLKTAILASADSGITTRYVGANSSPAPVSEAELKEWLSIMDPIEGYRFIGNANVRILFQNGRSDPVVTPERAAALHSRSAEPKDIRWYDAGHALNAQAYVDQLRWLAETIGTVPPGPEDAAGPQIPAPKR
jgi:dienelactone hydrolase